MAGMSGGRKACRSGNVSVAMMAKSLAVLMVFDLVVKKAQKRVGQLAGWLGESLADLSGAKKAASSVMLMAGWLGMQRAGKKVV
jgi:hypothetical protein